MTFPLLGASTIDQVSMEVAGSKVAHELLDDLGDKVVQGVLMWLRRVEPAEEVATTPESVLTHLPNGASSLRPCGMVPLSRETAAGKLAALGAGTRAGLGLAVVEPAQEVPELFQLGGAEVCAEVSVEVVQMHFGGGCQYVEASGRETRPEDPPIGGTRNPCDIATFFEPIDKACGAARGQF